MTDYIKREDAINTVRNTFTGMTADTLELRINDIPSADVVPVVRCEDCKYYNQTFCEIWSKYGTIQTREQGFCYMAERKER